MSFRIKTEVCDDTRSFCSDQNEINLEDAPVDGEDWATTAANLGAILGTLTQKRTREQAHYLLVQIAAQIAQVDALLNPPLPEEGGE